MVWMTERGRQQLQSQQRQAEAPHFEHLATEAMQSKSSCPGGNASTPLAKLRYPQRVPIAGCGYLWGSPRLPAPSTPRHWVFQFLLTCRL